MGKLNVIAVLTGIFVAAWLPASAIAAIGIGIEKSDTLPVVNTKPKLGSSILLAHSVQKKPAVHHMMKKHLRKPRRRAHGHH